MRRLLCLLMMLICLPLQASDLLSSLGLTQPTFLKAEQAFRPEYHQQGNTLTVTIQIADNYYLYRHGFAFKGDKLRFAPPTLPPGAPHEDDYFGKSEVYYHSITIPITLEQVENGAELRVTYQGCTDGLCYPPTDLKIPVAPISAVAPPTTDKIAAQGEQERLAGLLAKQSHWLSIGLFLLLGLGLAFTPCVFPMYPILTGILAGHGQRLTTGRAFALSMAYVQGMALTYTLLGLVVASAGLQFQAALQAPWVLIALSLLFVLLALSMFGLFTLQLPASLQTRLTQLSNRQQGGSLTGVAVMGMISGLVCSPCTTAPLSGALLYVAQSGDRVLGAATLYALSLGMGLPLLLLGTSGGRLLPKAGPWMTRIKQLFGFVLLAVPLLLLSRLWDDRISQLAWALWAVLLCAVLLHYNHATAHSRWRSARFMGLLLAVVITVVTAHDVWRITPTAKAEAHSAGFVRIKTVDDLKSRLAAASGQPVLLDLYADWCVACKEFEHKTFPDPLVQQRFANMVLLQADVTANDAQDVALLNDLKVLGLPTLILFDNTGREVTGTRVTGFMGPADFAAHLDKALP